jgi:hypothetical protein
LLLLAPYAVVAEGAEGLMAVDFHVYVDADGDGRISAAELRANAEARGIKLTDEQVQAFLAADADGDGVDLDEFLDSLDDTQLGVRICCLPCPSDCCGESPMKEC